MCVLSKLKVIPVQSPNGKSIVINNVNNNSPISHVIGGGLNFNLHDFGRLDKLHFLIK